MARVRKPYWLPYSVVNWGVCNLIVAGILEYSLSAGGVAWASRFLLTKTLFGALTLLSGLYVLGRAALIGVDGAPRWRQARLAEPGEPPPGNRLTWPAPGGPAPRVATAAARELTQKRRPVPRDLGKEPEELVALPVIGFIAAVFVSLITGVAHIVFHLPFVNTAIFGIWAVWGAAVWVSITASIVLKTRRLNEDA